jgi:hypothetical protein
MSVSNTGPQPKLVQVHSTLLRSNQNGPVLDSGIVEMIYFVVFEKENFSRGTFPFKKTIMGRQKYKFVHVSHGAIHMK